MHNDDEYEAFVAVRNAPVRHEKDLDKAAVATVATGTRVFVRLQLATHLLL